jgi:hypothetical protein
MLSCCDQTPAVTIRLCVAHWDAPESSYRGDHDDSIKATDRRQVRRENPDARLLAVAADVAAANAGIGDATFSTIASGT